MVELTQKILSLDAEVSAELKQADTSSLHVIKKADLQSQHLIEEEQQLFEKQKERDAAALNKKLEVQRREATAVLEQKMKVYDSSLDVEVLVEQLFLEAKGRVCP